MPSVWLHHDHLCHALSRRPAKYKLHPAQVMCVLAKIEGNLVLVNLRSARSLARTRGRGRKSHGLEAWVYLRLGHAINLLHAVVLFVCEAFSFYEWPIYCFSLPLAVHWSPFLHDWMCSLLQEGLLQLSQTQQKIL
jgi:hypothetical protein